MTEVPPWGPGHLAEPEVKYAALSDAEQGSLTPVMIRYADGSKNSWFPSPAASATDAIDTKETTQVSSVAGETSVPSRISPCYRPGNRHSNAPRIGCQRA
jgi:hypothetical protein